MKLRVIGAPQRFGAEIGAHRRPLLTHSYKVSQKDFEARHLTETWSNMIKHFGHDGSVSYESFNLQFSGSVGDDLRRIGIAIGSSNDPSKRWPPAYWAQMIHLISDSYPELQIVLFGTVADKQLSNYIIENCPNSKMHDMTGRDVDQIPRIRICKLLISSRL